MRNETERCSLFVTEDCTFSGLFFLARPNIHVRPDSGADGGSASVLQDSRWGRVSAPRPHIHSALRSCCKSKSDDNFFFSPPFFPPLSLSLLFVKSSSYRLWGQRVLSLHKFSREHTAPQCSTFTEWLFVAPTHRLDAPP